MTFTPADVVELARVGILPEVDNEEVQDRNKADAVVKVFLCIQLT